MYRGSYIKHIERKSAACVDDFSYATQSINNTRQRRFQRYKKKTNQNDKTAVVGKGVREFKLFDMAEC